MKRWATLAASAAMVLTFATGCTLTETNDYVVTAGNGLHMQIRPPQSWQIVDLVWWHICSTNEVCAGNWLHDNVAVSGWGAAQWHTATHYYHDLWLQLNNQWFNVDECLSLHEDFFGGLNWEHYSTGCNLPPGAVRR